MFNSSYEDWGYSSQPIQTDEYEDIPPVDGIYSYYNELSNPPSQTPRRDYDYPSQKSEVEESIPSHDGCGAAPQFMPLIMNDLSIPERAEILHVALSPDDRLLAASFENGSIKVWDLKSQGCLLLFDFRTEELKYGCLAWSRDCTTLLSGCIARGCLWDLSVRPRTIPCTTPPVTLLESHMAQIKAVAISPDGTTAVTGSDWSIKASHLQGEEYGNTYWSKDFKELFKELSKESSKEPSERMVIQYSPTGDMLAAALYTTIFVWTVETGSESVRCLEGPLLQNVWHFVFSADGLNILAGYNNTEFRVWNIGRCEFTTSIGAQHSGPLCPMWTMATPPTGSEVVIGYDDVLRVYPDYYDMYSGHSLGNGVSVKANTAVYSPNGQLLAAGCHDGCVCLWRRAPNSLCPWEFVSKHAQAGNSVKEIFFSQDNARLVVLTYGEGKLRVLDIVDADH